VRAKKKSKRGILQKTKKRDWKMTVTMVKNAAKVSVRKSHFVVIEIHGYDLSLIVDRKANNL
jgi:hypothetical protein